MAGPDPVWKATQRARSLSSRDVLPWSMVSIHPSWPACQEAQELAGRLLAEPPILPLPTCRFDCYCSYRDIGRAEARRLGLI